MGTYLDNGHTPNYAEPYQIKHNQTKPNSSFVLYLQFWHPQYPLAFLEFLYPLEYPLWFLKGLFSWEFSSLEEYFANLFGLRHLFSCDSSSIPKVVTDSLTHSRCNIRAEQGRAGKTSWKPHKTSRILHRTSWSSHRILVESSNQTKPCQTKPNFTKIGITRSFLKLQAPDFAW